MPKLEWDKTGERLYETGIENCALYVWNGTGYDTGVAWNGITGVEENPSGAEATKLWADNINYVTLYSAEEFGATIKAYMYPDEFGVCDGSASLGDGVVIRQQERKMFAIAYKTLIGNDTDGNAHGYKLHILYGLRCSPSAKNYDTINDSPEAIEFSWEVTSTPVPVENMKPTSVVEIDSTTIAAGKLTTINTTLFGGEGQSANPTLLLPDDIKDILDAQ